MKTTTANELWQPTPRARFVCFSIAFGPTRLPSAFGGVRRFLKCFGVAPFLGSTRELPFRRVAGCGTFRANYPACANGF